MLETDLIAATEESRRLMVVLHGLGDSMEGYRWLPETLRLPWLNYLLVNAPDPYFMGHSWYDFAGDPGPGIERSRRLLFELIDSLKFPAAQMILFGFSQGSLMTIEVGLRYPQVFAGLIGISGYVYQPEKLLAQASPVWREQRFLITHGHEDPLIPIAGVREQMRILKEAGIRIDWQEFQKAHTIAGDEEVAVIRDFVLASYQ
jgi:phospholipase/carboxylesterase